MCGRRVSSQILDSITSRVKQRARLLPQRFPNQFTRTMSEAASAGRAIGPIETAMRDKLTAELTPAILDIANDSHLHRHHAAMKSIGGGSGETHFSVRIVSDQFLGKPTLARHRLVYQILDHELTKNTAGIHALSLKTLTPEEHEKST
ncbi:hypothetical protein MJO28_009256 [Puccinia striiformis f. sp. tritici]|uniref:BolA protein n=3 Tax=Puccinia striiformis TaxID=27350 RepID=A0A0L0VX09_9BASI|nr:hypothetical protein Pst134EA_017816 [Puccinia striiformis f. sp. tritici]KAI9615879.1 hypothetical protein H4Q26_011130 [Puccinia striiformis f. sp. tritici PST-130]KNF03849.1 hypothetical protein PSTG_02940 [Puccinia striiformis f. sp. tritici PST-78]POW14756.1 hypothetical protein PSTT_02668 [Puccinia striiformis]KAH9451211.1 hypothetical protein Pst134EB_018700 [Puccinia striiformis f. sp. tritici]KAH9461515.1 hypothetical protein Pst134EA_017816 [Puccinia striiformis f. sp. tritici]